jgi:hypothetical protein
LVRKAKGKKPPGRPKCRRNNNTKNVKEIIWVSVQWVNLAQVGHVTGCSKHVNGFRFHKTRGFSWIAELLLGAQKEMCTSELVRKSDIWCSDISSYHIRGKLKGSDRMFSVYGCRFFFAPHTVALKQTEFTSTTSRLTCQYKSRLNDQHVYFIWGGFRVLTLAPEETVLTVGRKKSKQAMEFSVNFFSNSSLTVILTFDWLTRVAENLFNYPSNQSRPS